MSYLSILGDSISTFDGCNPEGFAVYYQGERCQATGVTNPDDTWWAQVAKHLNARVLRNGSYSGSMVEGAGFPAGNSERRVAALGAQDASPDIVLVFMGINDYGWGGALAQAASRRNAIPENLDLSTIEPRVAGMAPANAAELFSNAYGRTLERIRASYPQAEVWCCTLCPGRVAGSDRSTFAYNLRGVHFDSYNNAIRNQAHAHGCRVADVRALGFDYEAVDGTHPTARGMRQLADMIACAMGCLNSSNGLPSDALDETFKSAEPCTERACVGCEKARGTGNAWYLVCENQRF